MRPKQRIAGYSVPGEFVALAKRRTAFLCERIASADMPLSTALANAYAQGLIDAHDVMSGRARSAGVEVIEGREP